MMLDHDNDTIVAVATPAGRGGVGIVRLSGKDLAPFVEGFVRNPLQPRCASYGPFWGEADEVLDQGLALLFVAPNSFTGETVLELQGHGGPVVMDRLLQRAIKLGARLARPGEFSERAFINNKVDLAQAEAIADLIDASSEQAARCALRSLQGEFSREVQSLVDGLADLRTYVEAAIDFPEEEIDFLADGRVATALIKIQDQLQLVYHQARQGSLLRRV